MRTRAHARQRRALQERVRFAHHQAHEVLERGLGDLGRGERERDRFEAIDIAQHRRHDAALVIRNEADHCHDGLRDGEDAAPGLPLFVVLDPIVKVELRGAQAVLHRNCGARLHFNADRLVVGHPVIELDALDELEPGDRRSAAGNNAAVVARCRDGKHAANRKPVSNDRTNHVEMPKRFVEPAKRVQQPAVNLPRAVRA